MSNPACPRCCQVAASPGACPACQFDIPPEWLVDRTISIAMTGARSAGKSVLIGVMMDQFEHFLGVMHKTLLQPLGTTQERFERIYRQPLYAQRLLLKPTPPFEQEVVEPLMWSFGINGVRYCLALTDAAGEDFESLAPGDARFAYLGSVDLIVSLIDPLKVPGVAAILEGVVNSPVGAGSDLTVLRQVLAAIKAHRHAESGPQYLALTLSKFDVLQHMRGVQAMPWQSIMNRPGAAMQRDPSLAAPFENSADSDLLQAELAGLLAVMGAELLLFSAREAAIPWRLFATSALGMSPTSEAVHRGGISPFRVLDLLKAALAIKGAGA